MYCGVVGYDMLGCGMAARLRTPFSYLLIAISFLLKGHGPLCWNPPLKAHGRLAAASGRRSGWPAAPGSAVPDQTRPDQTGPDYNTTTCSLLRHGVTHYAIPHDTSPRHGGRQYSMTYHNCTTPSRTVASLVAVTITAITSLPSCSILCYMKEHK